MNKNKILIVAATSGEIEQAVKKIKSPLVRYCITGIGMVNSSLKLFEFLHGKNDIALAIQAGIGGSFSCKLPIGTVVNIKSECFGDTGIETKKSFKTVAEAGWENTTRFYNLSEHHVVSHLKAVDAITVAMACGTKKTADMRKEKFNAVIESMEGAPFFIVCKKCNVPFIEIRSVSNYCGPHKDGKWDIPLAVKNLSSELVSMIKNTENEI